MGTATAGAPALVFHPLTVADVQRDTADALVVTFAVPAGLAAAYAFVPGQHVALRTTIDGEEVRRSYSICAPAGSPLRVGIKRVPGGRFSSWAHEHLRPGAVLDVLPPTGHFTCPPSGALDGRHVVTVAAGSGITPVLGIVTSLLAAEPHSTVTLVYVNRTTADTMFLDELHDLKDRHIGRLALWHLLTREPTDAALVDGRPDDTTWARLLARGVVPTDADAWYLCGPLPMVETLQRALAAAGAPAERVHAELFGTGGAVVAEPAVADDAAVVAHATAQLFGRRTALDVRAGESLLSAVSRVRPDAPFSCRSGVCTTCRALVRQGGATMRVCYGLEPHEVAAGYVLTCQAEPTTDAVELDFDA